MVGSDEVQWRESVESLTHSANAAMKANDSVALKGSYVAQIELLAKIAQTRAHDYDFGTAQMVLDRLRQIQDALKSFTDEKEKSGIEARVLFTEAVICDVQGTFNLFEKLQFVDAPVDLERAEKRYARVAQILEALGVEKAVADGVTGMSLRARGIRLFGQGRFNIEAADLGTARNQLTAAQAALEQAAELLQPSAKAGGLGPESAMYPGYCLSLSATAAAFGRRCEADGKAYSGKFSDAAKLLSLQLAMMEKSKDNLLDIISKVADSLAHRTAQEMELCDKRQKFFATLPSGSSVTRATLFFSVLTLVAFACQMLALKLLNTPMGFDYYVVILAASLVVGGIGAGLTTWSHGTNWFKGVAGGLNDPVKAGAPA